MVEGLDYLKKWLAERNPKAVREAVERELIAGANTIVGAARLRVPVESGALRDSIRRTDVRVGKRGSPYVAITAGRPTESGFNEGRLVEFGTVHMAAQPFLLPAFRANRRRIRTRMRKAIRDAVLSLRAG